MYWHVGIDEAGYGSILGPFVMAYTAVGFKSEPSLTDNWSMLSEWVFDHKNKVTERNNKLPIGDSKDISNLAMGLQMLGAPWRSLFRQDLRANVNVCDFLDVIECINRDQLNNEPWWNKKFNINLHKTNINYNANNSNPLFKAGVFVLGVSQFNSVCQMNESKGAVTSYGWCEIIKAFSKKVKQGDSIKIITDKHGGRNRYSSLIEKAFDQVILTCPKNENAIESRYQPIGTPYELEIIFAPKAENTSPLVAMASMLAKHLREECMNIFNEFWKNFANDLKPTAGYPNDAKRFIKDIEKLLPIINIPLSTLVRIR